MKLQINELGSWRHVCGFAKSRVAQVELTAAALSNAAGGLRFAILDDEGKRWYLDKHGQFVDGSGQRIERTEDLA